jgi:hypothetical protein
VKNHFKKYTCKHAGVFLCHKAVKMNNILVISLGSDFYAAKKGSDEKNSWRNSRINWCNNCN